MDVQADPSLCWSHTSYCRLLTELGFNNTSTLEGHFVLFSTEREKRDSRGDERAGREERGTGMKVKKQKK